MKNLVKGVVLAAGLLFVSNVTNAQQKVGHVNFEEIFQLTPEFKVAQDQLKVLGETKQKEIDGMVTELQKKEAEANDLMRKQSKENETETQTKLQAIGLEFQQLQTRVQEQQKHAQEEFQKKQQELLQPVQTKVMNAINAVAQEKGFAYVFDLASGGVIYFQGGTDVSADVKAKLGIK